MLPKQEEVDRRSHVDFDKHKDWMDKLFELGLLLITVLAASELGYAAVRFAEEWAYVNFVFRVLTIPIIILIMLWLTKDLIPIRTRFALPFGRLAREFSWALFGNLFVFEILLFFALSFTIDPVPLGFWVQGGTLLGFFVTLPATWRYREVDGKSANKRLRDRVGEASIEHFLLYVFAYSLILIIGVVVATIPTPL